MDSEEKKRKRKESRARAYQESKEAARLLDEAIQNASSCRPLEYTFSTAPLERETLHKIDSEQIFSPVDIDLKRQIYEDARAQIGLSKVEKVTCAICDCSWPKQSITSTYVTNAKAQKWRQRLKPIRDLHPQLLQHYDISDLIPRFSGMLLSRMGVERNSGKLPTGNIYVCQSCARAMSNQSKNPPKFAIANGFEIGDLPASFTNISVAEKRLSSITSLAVPLTVFRGGKHTVLTGHVYVNTMDPSPIYLRLPQILPESAHKFIVVIAGRLTPAQQISGLKKYTCRVKIVKDLLEFYISHNSVYKAYGISVNTETLNHISEQGGSAVLDVTSEVCPEKIAKLDEQGLGVRNPSHYTIALSEEEEVQYRETASVFVDQCPTTTVESLDLAKNTVLVRTQGKFVSDYDRDILAMAYPHLFPYGEGHPGTTRKVAVSFEECVRYYLRLGNLKFAQDMTFPLVAFNIIARKTVALSTTIRAKLSPMAFAEMGDVTQEEVVSALNTQKQRREDALAGRPHSSNTGASRDRGTRRADTLLRSVRVSQSHMWGSAGERLIYRRKAFSMDVFLKSAAVFVTITPSDVGTLSISVLSKNTSCDEVRSMEPEDVPSHAKRVSIAGCNPVSCAEYFEIVCNAFFANMVRFDPGTGLPLQGGGLFGYAKGYIGVVEPQESGTLHMHCVLFLSGLPRTISDFIDSCNDPDTGQMFQKKFRDFVDSVVSCSLPVSGFNLRDVSCPNCKAVGTVQPIAEVSERALKLHARNAKPTPTSLCSNCGATFGGCDVLRAEVRQMHNSLEALESAGLRIPLGETGRLSDEPTERFCTLTENIRWPSGSNAEEENLHILLISQIALLTQRHDFRHVASCFKRSMRGKEDNCRHCFPRQCVAETTIDENGVLKIARNVHNEYINTFNDVLLLLLRSNHEIRFLLGSGTTDALYYVLKYVTKVQDTIQSLERVLMTSFERRSEKEQIIRNAGTALSPHAAGRARVNSMALDLSKKQEVPATLAALYLRRGSALFSSHTFASLHLGQAISIVRNIERDVSLVRNSYGAFVGCTQYTHYLFRHHLLREMNLMQFVSELKIKKSTKSSLKSAEDDEAKGKEFSEREYFSMDRDHPMCANYIIQRRTTIVIPDIVGPRLPDRTKLETTEDKENYALMALLLISPFHKNNPVASDDPEFSFWESLETFLEEAGEGVSQILINFQEYYSSKISAKAARDSEMDLMRSGYSPACHMSDCEDGDEFEAPEHLEVIPPFEVALRGVGKVFNNRVISDVMSTNTRIIMSAAMSIYTNNNDAIGEWVQTTIDNNIQSRVSEEMSLKRASVVEERSNSAQIGQNPPGNTHAGSSVGSDTPETETTVELLRKALSKYEAKKESNESFSEMPHSTATPCTESSYFPSLESVALMKRLHSALQVRLFSTKCAKGSMRSSKLSTRLKIPSLCIWEVRQGQAKLESVEALQFFAKSWCFPGAVRTCAPTGIAASLIQGQTFHSRLELRGGSQYNSKKTCK